MTNKEMKTTKEENAPCKECAVLMPDIIRHIANLVCQKEKGFRDMLTMTCVCGSWRTAILSGDIPGFYKAKFALPRHITSNFKHCNLGLPRSLPMRIVLPLPLPRLVTRFAGTNSSASLVVAMIATEITLERSKNNVTQKWSAYKYEMKNDLIQLWKRAAHLGSKDAQMVLGEAFYRGSGIRFSRLQCIKDVEQSVLWLLRAVQDGQDVEHKEPRLARCELLLGYIFLDGQDGLDDADMLLYGRSDKAVTEAVYWFRRSAKHGNTEAQTVLRSMYSTGQY